MKPISIINRQFSSNNITNNNNQKQKREKNSLNKYTIDPMNKTENNKYSNVVNVPTMNNNKSLFNKSSKNKIEKNSTFIGNINKQNPTVLKSSYITGGLAQNNNPINNKILVVKNEANKFEAEKKNKFYPIENNNNKLKISSNNIKISTVKASFDQFQKYTVNSFDGKKVPDNKRNNNKTTNNNYLPETYNNDDFLTKSISKQIQNLKSDNKRSESFTNNNDYKSFDKKQNDKRNFSQDIEDIGNTNISLLYYHNFLNLI